jgi:hypothetical protein
MQHLFTVADVFMVEHRGCVLVPGLPTEPGSPVVRQDSRIRLQTPDGKEIDPAVRATELISYRHRPVNVCLPILLPSDIAKSDVPVGTDVILLEEDAENVKQPDSSPS